VSQQYLFKNNPPLSNVKRKHLFGIAGILNHKIFEDLDLVFYLGFGNWILEI